MTLKKYKFKCRNIGTKCDFEIKANSRDEVIQIATLHAKTAHGMDAEHPEVAAKVGAAIKS